MTRSYAAKRLLEHGPLSLQDFAEITGWGGRASTSCLLSMVLQGIVYISHISGKRHFGLTEGVEK